MVPRRKCYGAGENHWEFIFYVEIVEKPLKIIENQKKTQFYVENVEKHVKIIENH